MKGYLQYPRVDAERLSERVEQMRRYLCQLVDQLNILLNAEENKDERKDG